MSFVKILEHISGMISMDTHLKGYLGYRGFFDLRFLFIVEILNDVHNGSVSTLSSTCCQNIAVSPSSGDIVDMWPNIWCNNSRETLFLGIWFVDFYFSFVFTNACFLCAMCGNVTAFCVLLLKNHATHFMKKSDMPLID